MSYGQVTINTHSSIRIEGDRVIYFDPFKIEKESHDADIICITHSHFDHFDQESIEKIRKEDTVFIAPAGMKADLQGIADPDKVFLLKAGEKWRDSEISVEAWPAYNRFKPFHPKHNGWLGYLFVMEGVRYYIFGDTDAIKEHKDLKCDLALIPIGGTYTMTAKDAAALINKIRPAAAIPTHYGSVVGKPEDAEEFRKLVDPAIEVVVKL